MDQQPKSTETLSPEILEQKGGELQQIDLEYRQEDEYLRRICGNAEAASKGTKIPGGVSEHELYGVADKKQSYAIEIALIRERYGLQVDPNYSRGKRLQYDNNGKLVPAIITKSRVVNAKGKEVVPFEFDIIENSAARR